MKKNISAKIVLGEMLAEWNDQHFALGYAIASGDRKAEDECRAAIASVSLLIRSLGFQEGTDYTATQCKDKIGNVAFSYWKREEVVNEHFRVY